MESKISRNLDENIRYIKERFKNCDDVVQRIFNVGGTNNQKIFMIYTDNIVDGDTIADFIMTNVMERYEGNGGLETLMNKAIAVGELEKQCDMEKILDAVLLGDTALLMDGHDYGLIASTKGWPNRGVPTADTEVVVQGPKDAFLEVGSKNIVLIRRRIRDTRLKVERQKIGRRSKTDLAIMYMDDIVRPEVLKSIKERLDKIDIDGIFDSGMLEQLVEKNKFSPFPQLQLTERPDKASAAIMEGRVVLVVDNTPFVLILPTTYNVFFQAAEDYYERWEIMSFIRFIRYCASFIAIGLPGLYIALASYHPNLLPTTLALKIAESRQSIPFPAVIEILIMEVAFELLREAGIRLPSPVSSTIGIVGGIIIGQAAVDAGIMGPVVIIIGALTGICTFVIPNNAFVAGIRISKYLVIALSAILGLYGFWLGMLLVLIHLSSLKSFGIPYMFPFCSGEINDYDDFKDSVFRMPIFMMKRRPVFTKPGRRVRMKNK